MNLLLSLLHEILEAIFQSYSYLKRPRLSSADKVYLENNFPYYQRLNPNHKEEFVSKLEMVLKGRSFIGRSEIRVITQEMKLLIGATIVMVTFGFRELRLPHFSKILIYPDTYYSTISQQYHRGEVNPRHGIIVLSWNCFLRGYENERDGENLGIHEIAHALKLENIIKGNDESDFFDLSTYMDYKALAIEEVEKIKSGQVSFFRSAGGINEHEFFAVALENFFERPHQFFQYNSKLYGTIVRLLRQDPRVWIKEIA